MEGTEWECETCSADNYACNCYLAEIKDVYDTQQARIKELLGTLKAVKEVNASAVIKVFKKQELIDELLTPAKEGG